MSAKNSAGSVRVYKGQSSTARLMVVILTSAIYGVGLWVTSFLPTIPGITWIRPANVLSELFAVCFGYWGCLAAPIGDAMSNILKGSFTLTSIWWVSAIEFVCTAAIVFWGVSDPSLKSLRGKIEWILFAVIAQGLLTGFGIALGLCLQGSAPWEMFKTIGWTITLNEAIPALVALPIQRYLVFPAIVRMGWWWGRDLEKSRVPKDYLAEVQG